jgi:gamma-glutamyl:cysteine ligase YbdK (ATP-grasp superfamily)
MGIEIDRTEFDAGDYQQFGCRLEDNLEALAQLMRRPGFGVGPSSLGAELEVYIVDQQGFPLHANTDILAEADDPQLTLELNRYNLEYNLSPFALTQQAFLSTEQEITSRLLHLQSAADVHGGRIVPIGILPTLRKSDFGGDCITPRRRYIALVNQLIKRRGSEFRIDINGANPLQLAMADITLEGANTSFQVHYRVDPQRYADVFNAIQLVTPVALALAANSPTLFGHSLWHETRIPLFKQSIDTRQQDRYAWREPARVSFGQGWARRGAEELFREVVGIYPPILPICGPASPKDELAAGKTTPGLAELRLHQSTVWLWNRPIYDDADDGHLRIEMRTLPAGPTAVDMVANAAFLIGMAEGLQGQLDTLLPGLPFAMAEHNLYRAAQHGMDARLVWPEPGNGGCNARPVTELAELFVPIARRGLKSIGVGDAEIERYMGVVAGRLQRHRNGALWQTAMLAKLEQQMPRKQALHAMLERFIELSRTNQPVAEWDL